MIKAIIFDLGGVVVPEKGHVIKEKISEYLGLSPSEFASFIENYRTRVTRGEINLLDVYSQLVNTLSRNLSPDEVVKEHIRMYRETSTARNPEVLSLIEKLKEKYTVVCLTNTEMEIADFNKKNGLFDYFHTAFLSTDMGLMKPQPEIYLSVLEDLGCRPDQAVFIDDKPECVRAAEHLGIKAILFQGVSKLEKELASLGINP